MLLEWLKKLKESVFSSLPVFLVVLILFLVSKFTSFVDFKNPEIALFTIGTIVIILGMSLFGYGADTSMSKMGEYMGANLTKKQNMALFIIITFLVGVLITVAEPDLAVLADQVPINNVVLIVSVGIGVGIFLVVGALRILLQKSLKVWLLIAYGLLFAVASLVNKQLIPLSFDSGGVTTGPMTVPFILAFGIGIALSRGGRKANADSFGLVAFCSVGPILMVMILSVFLGQNKIAYSYTPIAEFNDYSQIFNQFAHSLLPNSNGNGSLINVAISIVPMVLFFLVYNFIFLRIPKKNLLSILLGVVFTYVGLVLFLCAVEGGYKAIGGRLGQMLGDKPNLLWLLILVGGVLGVTAVFAEPAVHVLTGQIESVSDGNVKRSSVLIALAIGNGIAIAVSMLRIKFQFDLLYIIVPGYIVAFALAFLVPDIYSAIAFDSGGVVSGPMNTTFILPYAIGACFVMNGNNADRILTDAFGTIAVVALMPLLAIQMIGLKVTLQNKALLRINRLHIKEEFDDQIIHF